MKVLVLSLLCLASISCYDFDRAYDACRSEGGRCVGPAFVDEPPVVVDPKSLGEVCVRDDECGSGVCLDGVCCNRACSGQCEACDVEGSVGTCSPVSGDPHGSRAVCTGSGTICGGTCDGENRSECVYPTSQCRARTCIDGGILEATSCNAGLCPQPGAPQACSINRCEDATTCATVTQLATGYQHTCALLSSNTLECWGSNGSGELGYEQTLDPDPDRPAPVPGISGVVEIAAGFAHTCARFEDQTVKCWGANFYGQLGVGNNQMRVGPQTVQGLLPDPIGQGDHVHSIALGDFHSCAHVTIANKRIVKCWGSNAYGGLGDGTQTDRHLPTRVCRTGSAGTCAQLESVFAIQAGKWHTCAYVNTGPGSGVPYCWGDNSANQTGSTSTSPQVNPVAVSGVTITSMSIGAGGDMSCGLDNSGQLKCWGANNRGQLGRGLNMPTKSATPEPVCANYVGSCMSYLSGVGAVSAAEEHACAMSAGGIRCWGGNSHGQLGDGSTSNSFSAVPNPIQAVGNLTATDVSVGGYHSCALLSDGTIRCWGWNAYGQVGPGHTDSPVKMPVSPAW